MASSANSDSEIKLQWLELPRLGTAASAVTHLPLVVGAEAKPSSSSAPARKRKRSLESLSDDSSLSAASDIDDAAVEVHLESTAAHAGAHGALVTRSSGREASQGAAGGDGPKDAELAPADVLGDQMRRVQGRYYSISKASTSRCYRCKETGHYAMFCTSAPRRNPCWICGETDHDCRDCNADSCFVCDEAGHRWGNCPNRATMEREVLRLGYVPGYGRHIVMMTGPESAAMRLMPRRALMDGRARSFLAVRGMMPAAQILVGQFCPLCAGEGHAASTCPHAGRDMALVQCVSCGARGHTYCSKHAQGAGAADIHSNTSDKQTPGRINLASTPVEFKVGSCFNCGSGGHEGPQCPKSRNHVLFDGSIGPQPADEPRGGAYGHDSRYGSSYNGSGYPPNAYGQGERGGQARDRGLGRHGYDSDSEQDSYDSYEEQRMRKRGRVEEPSDDDSESDDEVVEVDKRQQARPEHRDARGGQGLHMAGSRQSWAPNGQGQASTHGTGTGTFAGTCYKCGRMGHRAVDCLQLVDPAAIATSQPPYGRGGQAQQAYNNQGRHNQPFQSTFHPGQGQYNKAGPASVARQPVPPVARQAMHVRGDRSVQVRVQFGQAQAGQVQRHQANSSAGGSDDEGGERDPWYMRDPVAQKERNRIMSSSASAADKKLLIAKLRKTVKKNEKRNGK